mmetsp:Transcript_68436/g.198457  ORF Transcript_68436/g.198457 Transcript_68436/m.198457 type:complete len:209 (+) Transcript_68436:90-716(+)
MDWTAMSARTGAGALAGEPEDQFDWHESFRDSMKNMYRTSYTDMSLGREVAVRGDLPSGYGGHIPSVRHDVLFRNTAFHRDMEVRREDPKRDAFPGFELQQAGVPTHTLRPQGAHRFPTLGTIPHNSTTTMPKPPWGVATSKAQPLNHRATPLTTPRGVGLATPRLASVGAATLATPRPGSSRQEEQSRTASVVGMATMTPRVTFGRA